MVKPEDKLRGERIREAREAAGFSSGTRFAQKIGVRPESLSRFEHGRLCPSVSTLTKIALATGRSMMWLATGSETEAVAS